MEPQLPPEWPNQGYQPYGEAPAPGVPNPFSERGNTVLILGIIGMSCCPITGPVGWIMGRRVRLDAMAAGWPEPGHSKLGRILSILGTVYLLGITAFYGSMLIVALTSNQ